MRKYIQSKLRDTEFVYRNKQVSVLVKKKLRDCQLTVVSNKYNEGELA